MTTHNLRSAGVILITHAETDTAAQLAAALLAGGAHVAVTARHSAPLARILVGHSADDALAIAADIDDADQRARLLSRVEQRLGCVAVIVDGRTGQSWIPDHDNDPVLPMAS